MADETNILDQLISRVPDESLRSHLAREVDLLRGSRHFGLVFDKHLPESVRLVDYPIRKGVHVALRDESSTDTWTVVDFADPAREAVVLSGEGGERPVSDLVVVREFNERIYPGLRSVERIPNGPEDAPWHVVINGENYHALQALRSTHHGKVDLIYIDPPYNTGNDGWIYNDRYVDQNDRAKSSKWLSFLERRLFIARDLLKSTGVIVAAIGDEEHHRLRMLLDQVFGDQNFISDVVWQGGRKNDSRYVSNGADYMLIYAKDESALTAREVRWVDRKPGVDDALAAAEEAWEDSDGDAAGATRRFRSWLRQNRAVLADGVARYNAIDSHGRVYFAGDLSSPNPRPNLQYDLHHPVTGKPVMRHGNGWRVSSEAMTELLAQDRILFGNDHTSTAYYKRYLDEQTNETAGSVFERDRRASTAHLKTVLGEKRFPNPKDHEVLMRWFRLAAPQDAVIVDFFGGSGTTSEAVMRLNAEDGGTRQSILVTNNELGAREAKKLRSAGVHPGDPQWEERGVFEFVCRPRISTVVSGTRPDGSGYSEGLPANVEMFSLVYLDPSSVRRGREFPALAPLLWLQGGARGERIDGPSDKGWSLTDTYGVLFDIDALTGFADAVTAAATTCSAPQVLFIVTDSLAEYQEAVDRLPVGIDTVQLYEDYLLNYTDNFSGGAR
ncbi:site-specific DNA-methyltransferase [Mycolicibacterium fortuitum]|uniref:Site-specific DNA-methyltransferase n=2 Tax=Mycolicibacterium fortuitum TaxID=1766 RepID=A0AAE5AEP7_MYCFO|nr:site-specific DNA-methyltransferase [Mycolicibacterium fortuitum]MCV7143565.1 site-specific DNA-methyltransferase [Mycolicibacterium fortuitum]MDV7193188.1 site-specific DNA-methyltransferase [Mycolicibacterium fortuitum]MDV7206493.1 site-specific DNA-methyltransferase [Mycolicibacterium fortuitum]MDV7228019.1 site-specific DNA-methyltransferase [Mycolicibacterium fortuitum]MDV7260334.1 site-specific DNA-methyltransferase [Mycolicibacterium fortuitum]